MAVTRDKAQRLLNKSEMVLFGDSRNPALRALSAAELGKRVERTRTLRDKARDLLQRQKLGSRARTGSKGGALGDANDRTRQKGEVLDDLLQRFEERLKVVQRDEPAAKGASSTKVSARKAAAPAAAKAVGKKAPVATKKTATSAAGRAGVPAPVAARKDRRTTPARALENTRKLLAEKQRRDMEPKAYRLLDTGPTEHGGTPFASETAATRSQELHAGESRMDAIHGSVSTHDRHNQGKRDSR